MSRTTLRTNDGGWMAFGIDGMLNCWFVMVQRPDEETPYIYEPDTDKNTLLDLIDEHAAPCVEKGEALVAVALDLPPGGSR